MPADCSSVLAAFADPHLQKEKEELDDITAELELADEDELVP